MKTKFTLMSAVAGAAMIAGGAAFADGHLDEITVAYFLEWPTPNQFAQVQGLYDEALGVKVNWVSFDAGTAMSAAMASGDVHISFSQGVTPFLVATAAGQDLQIVDIAVSYSDNDNCVVRSELEITAENAAELEGKEVGVPLGTMAHSGFLTQMEHFGVDTATMKVVDMSPVDSAAAFANGSLDMVCGWGGPLRRMKEYGNPLLEGQAKEDVVGKVFDVTSIPTEFGEENPELLAKFLKVTADMNAMYAADASGMMGDIAKAAGMDAEGTAAVIGTFRFPDVATQLSDSWMGGGVVEFLANSAASLEANGQLTALDDYAPLVNSSYLQAASEM
ncbi:Taurine-binding periplasmic protein TauA [Candidatus Rhodobacter oscarellae]|uniref:Taurine-binding periplasmic protein TauA n=1 Tax=Candidatus Rhodobacter oscarellae TaxID=1675527 RepID=A0A0J9EBW3_9RHOB|nr:ABC transporter substrate-binding protein [Candidatus Rhodobacter lobularis]KMW60262.1 Taurine-binding periplasmic protein TauA [Candidatus Rhodobacter lobularis]